MKSQLQYKWTGKTVHINNAECNHQREVLLVLWLELVLEGKKNTVILKGLKLMDSMEGI